MGERVGVRLFNPVGRCLDILGFAWATSHVGANLPGKSRAKDNSPSLASSYPPTSPKHWLKNSPGGDRSIPPGWLLFVPTQGTRVYLNYNNLNTGDRAAFYYLLSAPAVVAGFAGTELSGVDLKGRTFKESFGRAEEQTYIAGCGVKTTLSNCHYFMSFLFFFFGVRRYGYERAWHKRVSVVLLRGLLLLRRDVNL